MTAIALYLLKMLVCSGILTGYYFACLQNKLFHQWNRFYLLLTVIFSVTFPLLYIPIFDFNESSNTVGQMVYKVSASELLLLKGKTKTLSIFDLIIYGTYCFVVFAFLLLFVFSLYKIYSLKRKSSFIQQSDINIYQTNASQAPFSFFKNIFWKQNIDLQSTEGQQILKHELVHVHEKHSTDKVFIQLVLSVFWINPFFWLVKKELTIIHEFIADKKSVENNDASVLASLILTTAYSSGRFDITNQFFHSSIKRRITMITENKDPRFSYLRRIAALFVLLATLGVLAFRTRDIKEVSAAKHSQIDTVPNADISKFLSPIQLDKNADTTRVVYKLNDKNISASELKNIPSEKIDIIITSEEKTAEGEVKIVNIMTKNSKANIIITKDKKTNLLRSDAANPLYIIDGKEAAKKDMDAINPNDIESVSVWKDATAIEKFGEKGINGVIDVRTKNLGNIKEDNPLNPPVRDTAHKTIGIHFSSSTRDNGVDTGVTTIRFDKVTFIANDPKETPTLPISNVTGKKRSPLYMIDGKEVTGIENVNPNDIYSMTVWKDSTAIARFGDKGKNGVIDLTMKKTTSSLTP